MEKETKDKSNMLTDLELEKATGDDPPAVITVP